MPSNRAGQRTLAEAIIMNRESWSCRAFILILAMTSIEAYGQEPIQPIDCLPSPRVNVVHGDNRGADIASEFLTGCDVAGASSTTPSPCSRNRLRAPANLLGSHLHLSPPGTDFEVYFWDKGYNHPQLGQGRDNDRAHGLEKDAILFFAGHSKDLSPRAYDRQPVPVSRMSLGNECARYFWMASCRVLAHGPKRPVPGYLYSDYIAPGEFDPGDTTHENVFRRWGSVSPDTHSSPLNPTLRMACGGSSLIAGMLHPAENIWRHLLVERLAPAEAFLLGLVDPSHQATPLCLAWGGQNASQSPLYDATFQTAANSFPHTHLWIEYPVQRPKAAQELKNGMDRFLEVEDEPEASPPPPPSLMPVLAGPSGGRPDWLLELDGAQPLAQVRPYGFKASPLGNDQSPGLGGLIKPADVCVEHHPDTGAVVFSWRPRDKPTFNPARLSPKEFLPVLLRAPAPNADPPLSSEAAAVLGRARVRIFDFRLDGAPADKAVQGTLQKDDIQKVSGCTFYMFQPLVEAGERSTPLLGVATDWLWGVCPASRLDGLNLDAAHPDPCLRETPALLTISFPARPRQGEPGPVQPVFTVAEARDMASKLFPRGLEATQYEEVRYRWGYKAAPPHCRQGSVYLVYQFDYRPKDGASIELGAFSLEVPAHKLCDPADPVACFAALEASWQCSPGG